MRRLSLAALASLGTLILAACGNTAGTPAGSAGSGTGAAGGGGSAGAGGQSADGLTARIDVTPESGDGPLEMTLSGCASTATKGPIVLYSWSFGDGTTGSGPVVKHVFSEGDQAVKLTITTAGSASASAEKVFSVTGPEPRKLVTDASGHPRLYFDAGHLAELQQRIAKTPILGKAGYKSSYVAGYLLDGTAWQSATDYAKTACQSLMGANFTATNPSPVESSREISDCVSTLAAGGALESDATKSKKYADAAISAMVHMADTWPSSGSKTAGFGRWDCGACNDGGSNLNNGELLYAVATSFDLLYSRMAQKDRDDVRDLLIRGARYAYQASNDPTTWWSKDDGNNWQAVVHGGLGIAALVLEGEGGGISGVETEMWIERSEDRILKYMDTNYDADGVNYEDADHFGYGLNFAAQFFFALRNVRGTDHFSYRDKLFQKAARYRVFAAEASFDGIMPNDEASPNFTTFPAQLVLASAYRDGIAQWGWDRLSGASRPAANAFPFKVGGNGDQSQLLQTALNYDDTVLVEPPAGRLPLGAVYPTFGRALFRSSWDDAMGASLAAESGVYGSHGHPNQGHFFFTAFGAPLLTQVNNGGGSGDFNVVIVDGKDQVKPGGSITDSSLLSKTTGWLVTPVADFVQFDTTAAYAPTLDHATRSFLFVPAAGSPGAYALVLDDLAASASHTYSTEMHFAKGLTATSKGPAHYQAAGAGAPQVDIFFAAPAGTTFDTSAGLAAAAKGNAASFATLLFPANGAGGTPTITPTSDGGVSGFTIGDDTVLFNPSQKPFTSGHFGGDAALVLSRGMPGQPQLFSMFGGKSLTIDGVTWITASAPANVLVAPIDGVVHAWVSVQSMADVSIRMPGAGSYVISIDDQFKGIVSAGADFLATATGLSPGKPHEIRIDHGDSSPAGCN